MIWCGVSLLEHSSYIRNVVYVLTHTHSSRVRMEYLQNKTRIDVRMMMQYVHTFYNLRVMLLCACAAFFCVS